MLMGRVTWDSIGRPLPGRRSLVLTRNPEWTAKGAEVFEDVDAALAAADDVEELVVIGGAKIYELMLPRANGIIRTVVQGSFEGDVYFPRWEHLGFGCESRSYFSADAKNPQAWQIEDWRR